MSVEIRCNHTSLTKGTRVVVAGKAEIEHWTDKDGTARPTKRILAESCGPDLRWATADVQKARRSRPQGQPDSSTEEEPF
jgi:single-strand DNA-binding protein